MRYTCLTGTLQLIQRQCYKYFFLFIIDPLQVINCYYSFYFFKLINFHVFPSFELIEKERERRGGGGVGGIDYPMFFDLLTVEIVSCDNHFAKHPFDLHNISGCF